MAYPFRLLVLFGLLAAIANAADRLTLDHIVGELRSEVRPGDAMDRMRRVYSTDRWFTFPKFHETTKYVAAQMKLAGLQNVEILGAPADGKTQAGFWTMPLAWDVTKATLEIVEPHVPEDQRMLADYLKIPASLGMWSGHTPPGGVTAELIEVKTKKPNEVASMNLTGKIVYGRYPLHKVCYGESGSHWRYQHIHGESKFARWTSVDQCMGRQRMGIHQGQCSTAFLFHLAKKN